MDNKIVKLETTMDYIKKDIGDIKTSFRDFKQDFKEFREHLDEKFVTRKEFGPVQKLAFGMAGTILTAFLLALVYLVMK